MAMTLTKADALRAYARALNSGSTLPLEACLADDFSYESQWVFSAIESKVEFLEYLSRKLETIAREGATVFAEMGTISAYGEDRPCVIVAQHARENLVGIALAKVENGELKRLDLCMVPPPEEATRSGEYPGRSTGDSAAPSEGPGPGR